jgi:hypothetical protein
MGSYDDHDDEALAELRRRVEHKALLTAERMLDDAATPATARASVLRAVLGDAAARRHDVPPGDTDIAQLSRDELVRLIAKVERNHSRTEADDAVLIEAQPTGSGVFG